MDMLKWQALVVHFKRFATWINLWKCAYDIYSTNIAEYLFLFFWENKT